MSESEDIAAPLIADANPAHSSAIDEEDRLRPEFVEKVLDAVDAGDDQAQVGRDPQRRLDRRLSARAEDGRLFRDQGVRPVA
jgi:hypothetical protein